LAMALRSPSACAAPIAYRAQIQNFRSPSGMPKDDGKFEPKRLHPVQPLRDPTPDFPLSPLPIKRPTTSASSGQLEAMLDNIERNACVPPLMLRSQSRGSLTPSSPTRSSEMRVRATRAMANSSVNSAFDWPLSPRPFTPGAWWKANHEPFDINTSRSLSPLVWTPSGSKSFSVAWHDSPQLAEPLKPPSLIPSLRSKSAARLTGRPAVPQSLRITDGAAQKCNISSPGARHHHLQHNTGASPTSQPVYGLQAGKGGFNWPPPFPPLARCV